MLLPRGGVAHGEASLNPTATTYDALPPSSTYRGPKVAGTYEGFVGVFTGVGIFILGVIVIAALLRWRSLRRKSANQGYAEDHYNNNEAFEMPESWNQQRTDWANESALELNNEEAQRPGFYSVPGESRSQEVFFEGRRHGDLDSGRSSPETVREAPIYDRLER